MSKCIHCGSALPPIGDCARCTASEKRNSLPPVLRKDLRLDRRRERAQFTELSLEDAADALAEPSAPTVIELAGPEESAPVAEVEVEPATEAPLERPAPLWRRMLAFAIDALAVGSILLVYLLLAALVTGLSSPPSQLTGLDALIARVHALQPILAPGLGLCALVALSYCAAFAFLQGGHTLGRRWMGIRLVDQAGRAPAPGTALARSAIATASVVFGLAGFWLALFDRQGQALHDKLTRTFVVSCVSPSVR